MANIPVLTNELKREILLINTLRNCEQCWAKDCKNCPKDITWKDWSNTGK